MVVITLHLQGSLEVVLILSCSEHAVFTLISHFFIIAYLVLSLWYLICTYLSHCKLSNTVTKRRRWSVQLIARVPIQSGTVFSLTMHLATYELWSIGRVCNSMDWLINYRDWNQYYGHLHDTEVTHISTPVVFTSSCLEGRWEKKVFLHSATSISIMYGAWNQKWEKALSCYGIVLLLCTGYRLLSMARNCSCLTSRSDLLQANLNFSLKCKDCMQRKPTASCMPCKGLEL